MKDGRDEPSPELRALLDREREIPPLPAAVRARAVTRARAAVAAGFPVKTPQSRIRLLGLRWALAAASLLMLSAVAGAAVYQLRARQALREAARRPVRTAIIGSSESSGPAPLVAPKPVADEDAPAPPPARSPADDARAELRLLEQARASVARRDYGAALPALAEHARRFKNGRLAEEREALRVRALAGLGRMDEARRAAQGFEAHFPRSVLLPAVKQMSTAAPAP